MERRSDDELRALTAEFRTPARPRRRPRPSEKRGRRPRRPPPRGVRRRCARPVDAHARPAPLRRPDHGRRGLHFGWVAEMKTGEGKTLVATLPAYLNALAGYGVHLVTVNDYLAKRDAEWMGQLYRFLGLDVGVVLPEIDDWDDKRGRVRGRHHLRHQQRVRLRLPARQHGGVARGAGRSAGHFFAIVDEVDSILIDEARTPLIISGRADDAAAALLPVRADREGPPARPRLRGRRGEAHRRPDRGGHRARRGGARRRQPLRARQPELRPPAPGRAAGQGAVQARRRLRRPGRRGQDRRRVHRPHPRGPALERRSAPGGRGQGGRADQGGEPDPRDGHPPELLPHVREARRA